MNASGFLQIIDEAFAPFLSEMGFAMQAPSMSGRYYHASFKGETHVVSISYEPGDNALFVRIRKCLGDQLSDIDDASISPHLADLNRIYGQQVTTQERETNETFFKCVKAEGKPEKLLLKVAKELKLVLPKYLEA